MAFGSIEGFSAPPSNAPDLEHWFAQIKAEIEKASALGADEDETITGDWTFSGAVTFSGTTSGIDHGALDGLGDDDHPQYAEIAGSESITGDWDFPNTGFTIGADVNLYRAATGVLATDDEFRPLGDAAEGSSAARPIIHHTTGTASAVGIQGALHTEDV